jgi:hypothetical protein
VEMSPTWSISFAAIFLRMRLMILPERVFGRPGAQCISSGCAIGPISFLTSFWSSYIRSSVYSYPFFSVTYA